MAPPMTSVTSGVSASPWIGVYSTSVQTQQIHEYYQQQLRVRDQYYQGSLSTDTQREVKRLQAENAELKKQIEHYKKGGFMTKPTNFSKYFDSDYDCREHSENKCGECYEKMIQSQSASLAIIASSMVVGDDGFESEQQKITAEESLNRQLRFVKKALAMGDPALKKKKVKELPELIKKAQDEITIGGMQELLGEDNRDSRGILKGLARFFLKMGKKG